MALWKLNMDVSHAPAVAHLDMDSREVKTTFPPHPRTPGTALFGDEPPRGRVLLPGHEVSSSAVTHTFAGLRCLTQA